MDVSGTRRPQSVSKENSWSNDPSAVDSSQGSDHHTVSEMMSTEPKSCPDAEQQIQVIDSRPIPSTGVGEPRSPDVTIDDACKPLSSDVLLISSKSAEVISQSAQVAQPAVTGSRVETAVSVSNTAEKSLGIRLCSENNDIDLVNEGSVDKRSFMDPVDSKDNLQESDSEATPKNERSVQEDDILVHLDDQTLSDNQTSSTLSSHGGVKASAVASECQPLQAEVDNTVTPASDVEPRVHEALPTLAGGDAERSPEDNGDLKQSLGRSDDDISVSSHSSRSREDVQHSSVSRPLSQSTSTSSRHSASGASRTSSSSNKVRNIDSDHSHQADSVSSRSASVVNGIHSTACTVESDRSVRADTGSSKLDIVDRQVFGRADSVQSNIESEGSHNGHTAGKTSHAASLHLNADATIPEFAVNGREVQQKLEDFGTDTDDDVADLEADLSLHTKPTEAVPENVDKVSALSHVTLTEAKENHELRLDEEVVYLKDEQMPEELDSSSDFNEDGHGFIHSSTDAWNLHKNTSEPQSDTSESRSDRKSDDLHRVISEVAAAVESFVTEDERAAVKVSDKDEHLTDDRCGKVAAGATQNLLVDAIDQMLSVRNHKMAAAAAASSTLPAVPLSPSALSDNVKSTASTSSDGQVSLYYYSSIIIVIILRNLWV